MPLVDHVLIAEDRNWIKYMHNEEGLEEEPFLDQISIMHYLGASVKVEEGTSFGRVLRTFIDDPFAEIMSGMLYSQSGNRPDVLKEFEEVLAYKSEEEARADDKNPMDYVQITPPPIEEWKTGEFEKRKGYADPYKNQWWCDGYGDWPEKSGGGKGGIAIEHTPVCDLQHIPFRIKNEQIINSYNIKSDGEKHEEILRVDVTPTVFDLISAIVYEMTFFGVIRPGDRTFVDDAKEIKKGEEETHPIEFDENGNMIWPENNKILDALENLGLEEINLDDDSES